MRAFLIGPRGPVAAETGDAGQHVAIPMGRAPQFHPVTPAATANDVVYRGERKLVVIEVAVLHGCNSAGSVTARLHWRKGPIPQTTAKHAGNGGDDPAVFVR